VLLTAVAAMLLAAPVSAGAATAVAPSQAESDQAPAEIALLGVCFAVLLALVAMVIRRGRARRWRPSQAVLKVVRAGRRTVAEPMPDDMRDGQNGMDGVRWRPAAGALITAAIVLVLVGSLTTAVYLLGGGPHTASRGSVAAAPTPVPGQTAAPVAPAAGSPTPAKHPARGAASPRPGLPSSQRGGATSSGSASGSSTGQSSSGPNSPGHSSSGPSSPPPAPALGLPSGVIQTEPNNFGEYAGEFTLTATGGPVSYTISEPTSNEDYYVATIEPNSGTVTPGQPVTVLVYISVTSALEFITGPALVITVNPGGTVQFAF
jgi:uncharacterized membrane protein YgcG